MNRISRVGKRGEKNAHLQDRHLYTPSPGKEAGGMRENVGNKESPWEPECRNVKEWG